MLRTKMTVGSGRSEPRMRLSSLGLLHVARDSMRSAEAERVAEFSPDPNVKFNRDDSISSQSSVFATGISQKTLSLIKFVFAKRRRLLPELLPAHHQA